jgi:hypothetical protein
LLDRLAGQGAERRTPPSLAQEIAVFNPSPHVRTDVVRVRLDPYPAMRIPLGLPAFAPLALAASSPPGFTLDGRPVRVVPTDDPARVRWLPDQTPFDVEVVVHDVPPFGVRRLRLEPDAPSPDVVDDGREIATDPAGIIARDDGTLDVRLGAVTHAGLLGVEDVGDRGDSYDCDPVPGEIALARVEYTRRRHPSGIAELEVRRVFSIPRALADDRAHRSSERADVVLTTVARVAPGVARVDLRVRLENAAADHRLRLRFPTGRSAVAADAATTFGVATRPTGPRDDAGWVHPAPRTFPHQGWVSANGLTVVAPGLPEAEVTEDGTIAITLVRASAGSPATTCGRDRSPPGRRWRSPARSAWARSTPSCRSSPASIRSPRGTPSSGCAARSQDRSRCSKTAARSSRSSPDGRPVGAQARGRRRRSRRAGAESERPSGGDVDAVRLPGRGRARRSTRRDGDRRRSGRGRYDPHDRAGAGAPFVPHRPLARRGSAWSRPGNEARPERSAAPAVSRQRTWQGELTGA